MSSIHQNKQ